MKNIHDYTLEIIDTVMNAANVEDIYRHKILKHVYNLKSYKDFKHRELPERKPMTFKKPAVKLVFHTVPNHVQKIMLLSCEKNDIDIDAFCSNRRFPEILEAQRMVIFFLHKHVNYNSVKVARWFMKDHSTILNACRVHEARMETEKLYQIIYKNFSQEAMKIIDEV